MLRAFDRTMDEVVRTRSREADIGQLPQLFTEIGLAVGMALLAAVSFGGGQSQLLFGVFAVADVGVSPEGLGHEARLLALGAVLLFAVTVDGPWAPAAGSRSCCSASSPWRPCG